MAASVASAMADSDRLVDRFLRLAAIDSPPLQEGAIAAAVRAELEALDWRVTDDGTGPQVGNLVARWPGATSDAAPLFFCSHLDVVEPCRSVRPRVRDGMIESDGTTLLGADAKAGVAALLEVARIVHETRWTQPLEFVFTWGEEVGHRGAKAFDRASLRAPYGFVLDALLPVGSIVVGAPGYDAFTVRIQGRAAHAGVEPERGISAPSRGAVCAMQCRSTLNWSAKCEASMRSDLPCAAMLSVRVSMGLRHNSAHRSSSIWSTFIAAIDSTGPRRRSNARALRLRLWVTSHTRRRPAAARTRTTSTPRVWSAAFAGLVRGAATRSAGESPCASSGGSR